MNAQPVITTVAGSDLFFQGNGQNATSVPLGRVSRVATDSSGRPVFADPNYNLVFRVNTDGTIQTIAGNNVQGLAGGGSGGSGGGYSGDGGPATQAALNRPTAAVYDASGNLYISDTYNQMVRVVSPQGVINRYAGTGVGGRAGDGGSALSAQLNTPTDLAVDGNGNLYINDSGNFVIRKVTPQGMISTVAGSGGEGCSTANNVGATTSSLGVVNGLALDGKGNLYFSECARVREVSGGTLSTAPMGSQTLSELAGLAFDAAGELLIADEGDQKIFKLVNGALTAIAGTGQFGFSGDGGAATSAMFQDPFGLAVKPTGEILVADLDNLRVRQIDTKGVITTIASNGALISSQNGVPALLAALYNPFDVNFDSQGGMLIADTGNNIVRRMATPANRTTAASGQVLATVAGNGASATTGDNGPATQAGLAEPVSVSSDAAGDLFIAEQGHVSGSNDIRKVLPSGTISTFGGAKLNAPWQSVADSAGNLYVADFSGTVQKISPNGTQQQVVTGLQAPAGLAMDSVGNLYVSDFGSGKIYRYSAGPAGLVGTTIGSGFTNPAGLAVDTTGNVYVAEFSTNLVKVIAPNGKVSTVAGNGSAGFAGDNGPATGASLNHPFSVALDSAGALYIGDLANNRIREVLTTSAPTFAADSASVTLPQATSNGPVTQPLTVGVSATLNGAAFPGLLFSVTADQPWLQATASNGTMPAQLTITADPTGLQANTYSGNVVISAPGANPATQKVAVSFTVVAAQPARLCMSPSTMSFSFTSGASAQSQTLAIQNTGSGTGNYSIATCGAPWLAVSPASGTVAANSPGSVTVTVTPGQLSSGTSFCNLTITGGGYCDATQPTAAPTGTIGVSALLNNVPAQLLLSQAGITFPAIAGGGTPLPRTFGVLNIGGGQMPWTAAVSTTSGGSWLNISPASGTVTTPFTGVSQVTVSVNPGGLAAGTYYGSVTVTATGLPPQSVTIVLNVQAPGTAPAVDIYPAALVFSGTQGVNPSSQTVSIADLASSPITFASSRLAATGDPQWFVQTPTGATISPNQPINLVVQPDFSTLSAGTHQGTVALRFSDGSTGSVTVNSVVTAASAGAGGGETPQAVRLASCTPKLNAVVLEQQPLTVTKGTSATIQVQVSDSCNNVLNAGNTSVSATFPSNTSPTQMKLNPGSTAGVWEGTWTPSVLPASGNFLIQMNVNAIPANFNLGESAGFTVNATVKAASTTPGPTILAGGVVSAASYAAGLPLAPCSYVSIFGSDMATGSDQHEQAPNPVTLAGTQLQWSGQSLALLAASDSQINAQVPCELTTDTQLQIQVNRSGALSQPYLLPMAQFSPALFTAQANGQGQASVLDYGPAGTSGPVVLDPNTPAHAGDILAIYCTGLGAVSPPVPTGQPAAASPLSQTLTMPTVTIGGVNAPVSFSGMAPGFAGLYQVNVTTPSGITPGSAVPLVLTMGNISTSQFQNVTIAVK